MLRILVRLVALLAACLAHGAWESWAGAPLIERLDLPLPLRFTQPTKIAEHPVTGEIVVGDYQQLLSFDGANWRAHGRTDSAIYYSALAFTPDGAKLWSGGIDEIGYFERSAAGDYVYHSLTPHLPPEHRSVIVWACRPSAQGADIVSAQKVLRWDGTRFHVWEFPTALRLFPVEFEGALWFSHPESGLYRFGEAGPELVARPSELPEKMPMAFSRRGDKLVAWSGSGVTTIEPQPATLSSPELTAAMAEGNPTAMAFLPDGLVVIGTVGIGLLVADSDGNLVARIPRLEGHTPPLVWDIHRDRAGALWLSITGRVLRLPSFGGVQGKSFDLAGATTTTGRIASDAERVWVLGNRELHAFHRPRPGSPPRPPDEITLGTTHAESIALDRQGLLLASHAGILRLRGTEAVPELKFEARTIFGLQRLRPDLDVFATQESDRLSLLRLLPTGAWDRRDFDGGSFRPSSLALDWEGQLWSGSYLGAPLRRAIEENVLRDTTPPEMSASGDQSWSWVFHGGEHLWLVQRSQIWRVARDGSRVRLPFAPESAIVTAAPSPDGRRLFVALDRGRQGTRVPHGLGIIELGAQGEFLGWREPWVPGLHLLGQICTLHATLEPDGSPRIWAVGQGGMLTLRLDALGEWTRPLPPLLAPIIPDGAAPDRLPFVGHAVSLRLQSPEIARRPELRFETRLLRGDTGAWAAGMQDLFTFSNLPDGSYRFEARTVTPTGAVSEPVAFSFRVLPPWYRRGWAYAGYAALGLVGVVAAIRYRERRVRARNAELERLVARRTAELEKANAAKDEFLASMSHEIRNPLNGVVGLSSAIDAAPLDPDGRHRFELLRHCANHLATLLEDILDFARLQSGQIDLHEEPFSPAELLESVEAIVAAESAAAGVPVRTALAPNVPAHLRGDARRLRQILLNFVANALKYAGRGKVEVAGWTRPLDAQRVELTLAVSDEGPGIPEEEQARVFTKFERGSAARRARIAGTGMGLAVCRQLAERMGGRVWLESRPGQGCTFFVALPLTIATAPETAAYPAAGLPPEPLQPALVVDDEEYNRLAHAALLERLGYTVHLAADAEAACAIMAATPCAVVLLDYDLPDVTGPELARRLRSLPSAAGARAFLIAVTAYTTVEKRAECLAAGMDAFLGKPVSEVRLRQALASVAPALIAPEDETEPATAVAEAPAPYGAVSSENLRDVARRKGQTLAAACEVFARDFAAEMAQLHEAIVHRRATAARLAHQLAGRLGFVRAAEATQLALDLEQAIRSQRWEETAALEERLAAEWEQVRDRLSPGQSDPAASGPA